MRIIYSSILPFKGFIAMNICGLLFVRKELRDKMTDAYFNHEAIHTAQMKELWYVGFYLIYLIEGLIRLLMFTRNVRRKISFEREAYAHETEPNYLLTRKTFAQWL